MVLKIINFYNKSAFLVLIIIYNEINYIVVRRL